MDLPDVARLKWRRRWVTLPLLALSAVAAAFALQMTPPEYSGTAQIAVLPPTLPVDAAKTGEPANQFTAAGLAEFLSISLSTLDIRRQIEQEGLSADYRITFKAQNLALLGIAVEGKTAELVTKTIDRLTRMVEAEVAKLQGHLKPGQAITLTVADRGEGIKVVRTTGEIALIVILGVGLIVTLAISLTVDVLIRRRRRSPASSSLVPTPVSSSVSSEKRVVVMRPAIGVATVHSPETDAAHAVTVLLDETSAESAADNDITIVLPLSGVSWANGKKRQKGPAAADKDADNEADKEADEVTDGAKTP